MNKTFRGVAIILAVVGAGAHVGAWLAGEGGTYLGYGQQRLWIEATNILLASIAFGVLSNFVGESGRK